MDAVVLIETPDATDVLEKGRHERRVAQRCQIGEGSPELRCVGLAEIGRRLHPGDHDRRSRVCASGPDQDRVQIGTHPVDRQTAQAVVRAQLEDQHIDGSAQHPVDARQAAGRRFPADARVDHLERQPGRIDTLLDDRGECLILAHTVSCGQAGAEKDDGAPLSDGGSRRSGVRRDRAAAGRGAVA
jgi:hypothetical protein